MGFDYVFEGKPPIGVPSGPALGVDAASGTLYVSTPASGTWSKASANAASLGPFVNDARTLPNPSFGGYAQGQLNFSTTTAAGGANKVWVSREFFNRTFSWASIEGSVATNVSANFYIGLYGYDGLVGAQALIAQCVMSLAAAGRQLWNLSSPLTIAPGMYWVAYGCDDVSATSTMVGWLWDGLQSRWETAIAANQISAGSLPATLGSLTYNVIGSSPIFGMKSDSVLG